MMRSTIRWGSGMRVLFVTSEAYPLAKSGGLADVSSALPMALKRQGIDVRILMPGYSSALTKLRNPRIEARLPSMLGVENAAIISGQIPNSSITAWLVDAPSLFCRNGGLYQDEGGKDWADNALRFAFLAHAAARLSSGLIPGWKPDVVHANDWHIGLLPLLFSNEEGPHPATVFTIHNLAFQGNFSPEVLPAIGVAPEFFHADGMEFYGQASFLKTAIRYSDKITTVSPTYAQEVLEPEHGCGLDGVLRDRGGDFSGILNGIDGDFWNPATDINLAQSYSARDISGKRLCKAELQREFGLPLDSEAPVIGFVSRLAHQKMADVIHDAIPAIAESGAQFVLVAEGDPALEAAFEQFARQYPQNVAVHIGYDEVLAHRLQAGADMLLAPARFEPCGLTQLYALRYGTIPIVRNTGGLADTVTDATAENLSDRTATGIVFEDATLAGLLDAINRALALYREKLTWRRLQLQGMAQDFSWDRSAAKYAALYHEAAGIPYPDVLYPVPWQEPDVLAVR
jgi:starch synthase